MKNPPLSQFQRQNPRRTARAASVMETLVIVIVALVLVGFIFPAFNHTSVRSPQIKALHQAKQIGLALKLYAGDHDGVYPDGANLLGEPILTSNDAFRSLFPAITQSETIFGNKLSAWQTSTPDNVITILPDGQQTLKPGERSETLKPGENVYAYMAGLTDAFNPGCPLVADGTDGTGHYVTNQNARGGVWSGAKAIVIRLDNSGALENLTGPSNARYVARPEDPTKNLLDGSLYPQDLNKGIKVRLLNPAAKK